MLRKLSVKPDYLLQGLILLFISLAIPSFSQQDISGVINQYSRVTAIGTNSVTVADASFYQQADTVLLMQMSGVIMLETGDPGQYQGDVGTPGEYGFFIIQSVDQGSGIVTFTQNIDMSLDVEGFVQLVTVPSYNSAVVSSVLTCQQWNRINGTGGILAFSVKRRLTLNASIDVSGKGFSGGAVSQGSGNCASTGGTIYTQYFYDATSNYSGFKGEGLANKIGNSTTNVYPVYAKGKAPSFTGGGGGNGYSSGGGGGSGYGAGATGDPEYQVCSPLMGPGGLYGKAIAGSLIDGNVFMGGGGGASTYPSTPNIAAGGNGGGIIIIFADTIIGNNQIISAIGDPGVSNTLLSAGAGGGGGGGSVIIDAKIFSTYPVLMADGGHGGNTVNTSAGCSGGGGGGGLVWTRDLFAGTVSVEGGAGGLRNTTPSGNDGETGRNTTGLVLPLRGFLYNAVYSDITKNDTDSICEAMIPPTLTGTIPFGGTPPYQYRWQKSYDNTLWTNTSGTQPDYSPTATESATVWFRRVITDSNSLTDISQPVQIIVHPKISGNTIGNDTILCFNQDPLPLVSLETLSGGSNSIYSFSWSQSNDNINWSEIGATNSTYDPSTLTETKYYKRTVTSGACTDVSAAVTVDVLPLVTNNTISSEQIICQGMSFADLEGTTPVGGDGYYTYQWRVSTDGTNWEDASGDNSNVGYDPQIDVPGTYYYSRRVSSGLHDCCTSISNTVALVSLPEITNNVISSSQTICEGDAIAALEGTLPSGGAGSGTYSYQWQKSLNGTDWDNISGATLMNYSGEPLYNATYYRRIVFSSACSSLSGSVFITIIPAITNYSIALDAAGHDTICTGDVCGMITGSGVGGGTGTYSYTWYYSTDNVVYHQIPLATANFYQPGSLNQTTWYSRIVTSSLCTESDTVKIVVLPAISDNTVSSNQNICNESLPIPLDGSLPHGGDGRYRYIWEERKASASVWSAAYGLYDLQNFSPPLLNETTQFRRIVLSGEDNCCADTSDIITINVDIMPQNVTAGQDLFLNPYQFAFRMEGAFDGQGTAKWNVESSEGDPVFEDNTDPLSVVKKLGFGENIFRFEVSNGVCKADPDFVTLTVPKLSIPEGFSPNGDGINDYFIIEGLEFTTNELVIINTGGAVVYKTKNYRSDIPEDAWVGTDNNGDDLPEGTYYFLLTINGAKDISTPKYEAHISGFIIIRR